MVASKIIKKYGLEKVLEQGNIEKYTKVEYADNKNTYYDLYKDLLNNEFCYFVKQVFAKDKWNKKEDCFGVLERPKFTFDINNDNVFNAGI